MMIKIEAESNGGHANQSVTPEEISEGWAVVPDSITIPDTFPFVTIETQVIDGVLTVTSMTAGTVPAASTSEEKPSDLDEIRLALAELANLVAKNTTTEGSAT